ncbi:MAG: zinc dependent phospholipase C family protein [Acutalibacter sp.]|nr:zinc dependent phospholipase C family protein [Acutalibacter sp.]
MPACLTHHLFAKNVLSDLSEQKELNLCAYYWGAQGPDFLFCHRYFPWMRGRSLKSYGSELHETPPSKTLSAMRDFVRRHDDPAYRSYVYGFICHYALDSTAHPYINALAEQLLEIRGNETQTTMHGEIEAALDTIVLRSEAGKLPSEVSLGDMFPKNEAIQRRIAKLYRDVLSQVYGAEVAEEELLRAAKDAHFVFSCLTDKSGLKMKIFDLVENGKPHHVTSHIVPLIERDDVDYANIQQEEWTAGKESSRQSFFELMGEAMGVAETLISNFDEGDFAALTKEKPFSGKTETAKSAE